MELHSAASLSSLHVPLQARQLAVLACTCKEFCRLASTEDLWENLFKKEFAAAHTQPKHLSRVGWKGLFAAAWIDRSERRKYCRPFSRPLGRLPWPGGDASLPVQA